MTGRNLHREAGSGKGVGGGCQIQKEGRESGTEVPFSHEEESLFWVFKEKKKKKRKEKKRKQREKKKWLQRWELEESRARQARTRR